MKSSGWIFLILSWTCILCLVAFCFFRIIGLKSGNILAPLDIETEKPARGKPRAKRNKK